MNRPVTRTLARYGLPETDRVRAELEALDLLQAAPSSADGGYSVLPDGGAERVLAAISRTGRPELAVHGLHALAERAGDRSALLGAVRAESGLRGRLLALVGGSAALSDHLVGHPEQWHLLRSDAALTELAAPERAIQVLMDSVGLGSGTVPPQGSGPADAPLAGAAGSSPDTLLAQGSGSAGATPAGAAAVATLRTAYRGRLLQIAAHDLAPAVEPDLPAPGLSAVCAALTGLADAMLQTALAMAAGECRPSATPARLAIIAMGKCGGGELNYLSDVDVMFVADHPVPEHAVAGHAVAGHAVPDRSVPERMSDPPASDRPEPDRPASGHRESAGRQRDEAGMLATATVMASRLMHICEQVAWEVDANLRPEGAAGPLVRTIAGYAAYYRRWAQTWEFQALLKARPVAGDPEIGEQFLQIASPGVWTVAERESFVTDVHAMRRRVQDNIPVAVRSRELKLGAGGLRDVEFAVQLLQLVHGRVDGALRVPGTIAALTALIDGGYVGRDDGAEMVRAYTFLRRVEHLLQLQRLRRTHQLPTDQADLEWLARTLGYAGSGTADAAEVFSAELSRTAATVRRLHEKLFYRPLLSAVAAVPTEELRLTPQAAASRLAALGFAVPDTALRHLASLTEGVSRRAAIQRTLLPVLLGTFADGPDPDAGLLSYRQVSEALAETPWYLRLLRDEGTVAQRLATLLAGSRLVGALLVRAPEVLRLLADDAELTAAEPSDVAAALLARAARAATAQDAVDSARSSRRHELLRLACADLLGLAELRVISAGLTGVAEASVQGAYDAARRQVEGERGGCATRLAVIGMGRLGGAELGYSSDADVMYVAAPEPGADPGRAVPDATAVADLLARLLGRPSPDPALEIDAGLRPEGRSGPLVRTMDSYVSYWERHAAPWERQALLRARPIAGDLALGAEFIAAADAVRYPTAGLTPRDITEIRRIKARVDAERLPRGADVTTHTKLGRGGLADVEWTVQLLQLRHGAELAGLRTTRTLAAIDAAAAGDLLTRSDADQLAAGWTAATRARNAIMLVTGKPGDQLPGSGRVLAGIARALGYPADVDPGEFIDDYRRATRRARRVVDRVFDQG